MKTPLLTSDAVQQALQSVPGWRVEGSELTRVFEFATYLAGIEFVRQTAILAEEMNHHPDLWVSWRKVTARLSTHSAGGLTTLDFKLAQGMQEIFQPHSKS